jgi:hypothetical protein
MWFQQPVSAAMTGHRAMGSSNAAKVGIGFGTALAITISWSVNKSILWAIVHGFLSWIYVIYYALKYR